MKGKCFFASLLLLTLASTAPAQHPDVMKTSFTDAALQAEIPFAEYPRPQLVREDWTNLNGDWAYIGGKEAPDVLKAATVPSFENAEQIRVPYPPESFLSGIQRKQEINMWYQRSFALPSSYNGRKILLNFGACDYQSVVFVNNKIVGRHTGGYEAFSMDITPYLKKGENTLTVGVQDRNDGRSVSGKNGPRGDYTYTSGIWQTVWLEPVAENYIKYMRLTPEVDQGRLAVTVHSDKNARVEITAMAEGRPVASLTGVSNKELSLELKDPRLWSPDDPFLYDLKITLHDPDTKSVDEVTSYFGMRSIELGTVNGVKRPLLNGKFVMQLGLLDQGYWPDGIYTAPSDAALKYDIEQSKKAGFNLIRKHVKTEPQRWYYWCDKMGMLVWQDMPCIWFQHEDTAVVRPQFRREWKQIIDQHYNAPSVITWVPFNENWGAFDVKEITEWTKAYDPSRLVNGNSGFNNNPGYQKAYGDPGNGDYVDTHIYIGPYGASEPDEHRAASLGEFGGVGLFVRGHMYPVENNAYDMMATKQALTDRYVLLLNQVEQLMLYRGLSVAIYTQTTDVEHEINGIMTYDRLIEKMDLNRVREINRAVISSGLNLSN